jgi:chromosome segregation ATPase
VLFVFFFFLIRDISGEASKQLGDYKFRAQKAEQDVATLQATVARLESQVIRYKAAAEVSEKAEEALKAEKRKLQREVSFKNFEIKTSMTLLVVSFSSIITPF